MATLPVKYFASTMSGAPTLNGTAGSLLGLLSACLVDGWGSVTLTSVTVASNVVTFNKTAHAFSVDQVIEISGVTTPAALNGQYVVASVATDSFTAVCTGISDQTATGTILCKVASAGWSKPYTGTNKAVFRSSDATSNKPCLRVLDTGTTTARLVGYAAMTGVDTGTDVFPTTAQVNGGTYWEKSTTANSTARPWILVADTRTFYFWRAPDSGVSAINVCDHFSEYVSEKTGDAYNALLSGAVDASGLSSSRPQAIDGSSGNHWGPREYTQTGTSVALEPLRSPVVGVGYASGRYGMTYPSPMHGGLLLSSPQLPVAAFYTAGFRCLALPGMFHTPQLALSHGDFVTNVPGLSGRKLLALGMDSGGGSARIFLDLTGPWR